MTARTVGLAQRTVSWPRSYILPNTENGDELFVRFVIIYNIAVMSCYVIYLYIVKSLCRGDVWFVYSSVSGNISWHAHQPNTPTWTTYMCGSMVLMMMWFVLSIWQVTDCWRLMGPTWGAWLTSKLWSAWRGPGRYMSLRTLTQTLFHTNILCHLLIWFHYYWYFSEKYIKQFQNIFNISAATVYDVGPISCSHLEPISFYNDKTLSLIYLKNIYTILHLVSQACWSLKPNEHYPRW